MQRGWLTKGLPAKLSDYDFDRSLYFFDRLADAYFEVYTHRLLPDIKPKDLAGSKPPDSDDFD